MPRLTQQARRRPRRTQQVTRLPNMATSRIRNIPDPPQISNDIILDKVVQVNVLITNPAASQVTLGTVLGVLPPLSGGARVRFRGVRVWGPAANSAGGDGAVRVIINENPGPSSTVDDNAEFVDNGTAGAQRPSVHLGMGWLQQSLWLSDPASPLFTLDSNGIATGTQNCVVHVSVQIRLLAPRASPERL